MTEIRPVELPEKDLPLRSDVSLLGSLVGQMLAEQHGEPLLLRVEAIRRCAIRERENGGDGEQLEAALAGLTLEDASRIIQAFSSYLRFVNLAEKVHRIRRRRDYQRSGSETQPGSFDAVIGQLRAQGCSSGDILGALANLTIQPVFTAHPTEATRRTIQEREYEIVLRLVERLNPERTPDEERVALERIRAAITASWQTRLVPNARPTVADELDNILFYITDILYRVVPVYYESVADTLRAHFGASAVMPPDHLVLRFGSWVGGDMDGNPNVNAGTIEETLFSQRRIIVRLYHAEARRMARYLSQSTSEVGVSPEVLQQVESYTIAFPGVAANIAERHLDMPYRCLMKFVTARLDATLSDAPGAYASVEEFIADLRLIEGSLMANRGEHAGLFLLRRLLIRAHTFGFHLATLDVRQDAVLHRKVMGEWLGDPGWNERTAEQRGTILADHLRHHTLPPQPPAGQTSPDFDRTMAVFRALANARKRYGPEAIGLFIISMTQGADDVLTALALARGAVTDRDEPVGIDFAPLLETVDDLHAGPDILNALLSLDAYRSHLAQRQRRQVVMVGYSDSNKDSGIAAARWALQVAQAELLDLGAKHGVDIVFFHGRGGTVSRGGGNLINGILGAPAGTVQGYLRLTEQGEVINRKYGVRPIALRNLELITGATLLHTLGKQPDLDGSPQRQAVSVPDRIRIMERIAEVSRQTYRGMVYDNPDFPGFFRAITPLDVIQQLTIGSRPSSRRSGEGIGNLRAIPWVFSWAQIRIGLPGVFGMGTALQQAVDEFGIDTLRQLLHGWTFFQALVEDVEMVLAKSELGIGARYASLVPAEQSYLFDAILEEFARATHWVLQLKETRVLLDDQRTLQRNIRLRNPYVDPLHLLQIDLLSRWRAGGRSDPELLKALIGTVSGISLGIQNTG